MVNNKQLNKSYEYPPEDKEILAELTDPNYEGGSYVLPADAGSLDKAKYEVCRSMVDYLLKNNLKEEQIAQRIELSKAEVKRMLRYRIDEFTLDRLITYADKLFFPFQVGVIKAEPRTREQIGK